MGKLKFKHPAQAKLPHNVLNTEYDIRFFVEEMTNRLIEKVTLPKNDLGQVTCHINNNWEHSNTFLIKCPVERTYTIMWVYNGEIDFQDIIETLTDGVFYNEQLMTLPELKDMDESHIFILLHKMDPEIRNDPRIRLRLKRIKETFNPIKKIKYFETSIHDYWSVIFSFSTAFKTIKNIQEVLTKLLKEFARATFSSGVVLIDKNFVIIDKHASNSENLRITDDGFKELVNKWADMAQQGSPERSIQIPMPSGKGYLQQFRYEDEIYYIMSYSRNPRTEKLILEKLPELANRVFEILMGYSHEILF